MNGAWVFNCAGPGAFYLFKPYYFEEELHLMSVTTVAKNCLFVRATPAEIWKLVSNPRTWPNWNPQMKAVEFSSSAQLGARGRFFLNSGPATPFEVTGLNPEKSIQLESPLLWLSITQEIRIVEITEGSVLVFEIRCLGSSARLAARLLRRLLTRNVERASVRLKAAVERGKRLSKSEAEDKPPRRRVQAL